VKFKIFISSTSEDLAAYREVADHVARRIGLDVIAMEDFGPGRSPPVEYCKQKVDSADIILGLYAHRYGFQPEGYDGKSIIHLEYEWALKAGKEICSFIVDDNQLWLPKFIDDGDKKARLMEFKRLLAQRHVIDKFTMPEQLRSQLFEHLPELLTRLSEQEKTKTPDSPAAGMPVRPQWESLFPLPPQPYEAHTYTLLQTVQVVGRKKELDLLDAWVSNPRVAQSTARVLVVVAIGGMGKSALAWKWFHDNCPKVMQPLAGRMWWSFYENDAGFDRFVTSALAYCTGQSPEAVSDALTLLEREAELLKALDEKPFLLTLDGAERLLIAYSGADFAHLADDELDIRTANHVAGALGLTRSEADAMTAQHRLRTCIDPHVGNFLKRLTKVRASRILITSRLYPSELQTVTGQALPGGTAVFLKGLESEDAIALWREMGVSGADDELDRLFSTFAYYPLLVRALAGEVARFRRSPGNFDAWRRAYPDFDPYTLPIVQVKTHVLEHALLNLGDRAQDLLHTIAAFRSPAPYDTLLGLFQREEKSWSAEDLDAVLSDLEDRGLVGWNRQENNYDLHPIVRGVVWSGLGADARRGVFDSLHSYFQAIPVNENKKYYASLDEAKPDIELFNALVGLQKYVEASEFYFDRIHGRENFELLGVTHLKAAMLNSLFPNGYDEPPSGLKSSVYAQLAHCFGTDSRFHESFECWLRLRQLSNYVSEQDYCYVSDWCCKVGLLSQSAKFIAQAEKLTKAVSSYFEYEYIVEHHIIVGKLETAELHAKNGERMLREFYKDRPDHDFNFVWGRVRFFQGNLEFAVRYGDRLTRCESKLKLGSIDEAIDELHALLVESRAKSWHETELHTRRILAEAYRRRGNLITARDVIDDFWNLAERGPYRLALADTYNVLAEIERDAGNRTAAIVAAEEAYRQAWCDGPPHAYHWALQKAIKLLDESGSQHPAPPERDQSFDDILDRLWRVLTRKRKKSIPRHRS
jgi:tetratricopeptide (TPR) repeat protein